MQTSIKIFAISGLLLAGLVVFFPKLIEGRSVSNSTLLNKKEANSDRLFDLINNWRKENNLSEYIVDNELCSFAKTRVKEIKENYGHEEFMKRFSNTSYEISENLSTGSLINLQEEHILIGWLKSSKHKEALEREYSKSCLVCDNDKDNFYCVQLFRY